VGNKESSASSINLYQTKDIQIMASRKLSVAGKPGSDPTLPKVKLTINGTDLYLVYDFNAIATAEELTGLELLAGSMDLSNLNANKYRALLYASLLKFQPDITLGAVGDLIKPATMPAIVTALVHAWTGSRPEIIADEKKDVSENPDVPLEQEPS
jgi:hypothetical protein